jgi:cyclin-dependent kinase
VFKAVDPKMQSETGKSHFVALKVTTPEMMTPPHNAKREARLLAAAKGGNIVELIETFQQAGGRYILAFPFMPFDLGGLLRQNQLNEHSRRQILKDLFRGLAHIHSLDIIHRDIKPSNILMPTPDGPAYIADFGIAWSASDPESEPADEKILDVGTTCYRPPELLFGGQLYGANLDMWAAGCVVAQVLCLGSETLFDAGDLGSELALIKSIFETLGTPDLEIWPVRVAYCPEVVRLPLMQDQAAAELPDWGKMNFKHYPSKPWAKILPGASSEAVDLVQNLAVYEYSRRLTAVEALGHLFFSSSSA